MGLGASLCVGDAVGGGGGGNASAAARTGSYRPPRAGGLAPSGEDIGRACGSPRKNGGSGSSAPYESRRLATGDVERPRVDGRREDGRDQADELGRGTALYAASSHCGGGSSVNGGGRWTRVADPGEGSGGACANTASGESERRAWSSDCAWAAAGCTAGNGPRKEAPYGALGGRDAPSGGRVRDGSGTAPPRQEADWAVAGRTPGCGYMRGERYGGGLGARSSGRGAVCSVCGAWRVYWPWGGRVSGGGGRRRKFWGWWPGGTPGIPGPRSDGESSGGGACAP